MKLKSVRFSLNIRPQVKAIELTEKQVDLQIVENVYEQTYDEVIKHDSMQVRDKVIDQVWFQIYET